MNFFKFM